MPFQLQIDMSILQEWTEVDSLSGFMHEEMHAHVR